MIDTDEIRWQQRLENFDKALTQLKTACEKEEYSDLERAGLVQVFEFTFELAWKTLKDLLFVEGFQVKSPRETIRRGFGMEYLNENDTIIFLDALKKRNLLAHIYHDELAKDAEQLIKNDYCPALIRLHTVLEEKRNT